MSESSEDDNVLSVKDVNEMIRNIVTKGISDNINVKGEISNLKISNGNSYLTIKDNDSSISAIMWKNKIDFKNGDAVVVTGKVSFFIKSGTYQITISNIKHIGIGDLHSEYTIMKQKFDTKGYFTKKRALPTTISRIGILTSLEGAALQDIMFVLNQNNYRGDVIIKNCSVQGANCPSSVKAGIKYFNKVNKKTPIDVLIVARGGGSFEDLMGYSSKEIVRGIHKTPIITISAIGHEVDFMLSDFSADIRAPTPSIAGEMVSHGQQCKIKRINDIDKEFDKIRTIIENKIKIVEQSLQLEKQKYDTMDLNDIIDRHIQKIEMIQSHVSNNILQKINNYKMNIEKIEREQHNYDYKNVLKRGYVLLVSDKGKIIKTKEDYIKNDKKLKMIFADGEIELKVK